MFLAQTDYIIR